MVGKRVGNIEKIRAYMKVCINLGLPRIGNADWKFGEIIESGDRYTIREIASTVMQMDEPSEISF